MLRNARALKLETNAAGTAIVGVMAEVNGAPERFEADIVVVSCGAANSAALLLRSANDKHPAGLANGSGQVGRNYMFHNSQAVLALSLTPNDTMFQKTLALNDFYFGMEGFPLPDGQYPDDRQDARRHVSRREAAADRARAGSRAGGSRAPRRRFLADDRGSARSRKIA